MPSNWVYIIRNDSSKEWGFRLKGGIDYNEPISVVSVKPGSLAEANGLKIGMRIKSICHDSTSSMRHQDVLQAIIRCCNELELEVTDPSVAEPSPSLLFRSKSIRSEPMAHPYTHLYAPFYSTLSSQRSSSRQSRLNTSADMYNNVDDEHDRDHNHDQRHPRCRDHSNNRNHDYVDSNTLIQHQHRYSHNDSENHHYPRRTSRSRFRNHNINMNINGGTSSSSCTSANRPFNFSNSITTSTSRASSTEFSRPTSKNSMHHRTSTHLPDPKDTKSINRSIYSLNSEPNMFHGDEVKLVKGIMRDKGYKVRPICFVCRDPIYGPFIDTNDHCFCPEHFTCCMCQCVLNDKQFAEHREQIYCKSDFTNYIAPKCSKCHEPIIGKIIKALDKTWHPKCFKCDNCGLMLDEKFYLEDFNRLFCEKHWQDMHEVQCAKCRKAIKEIDRFVELGNKQYHVQCFCCAACQTPLEGKQFHARDSRPYCPVHVNAVPLFA